MRILCILCHTLIHVRCPHCTQPLTQAQDGWTCHSPLSTIHYSQDAVRRMPRAIALCPDCLKQERAKP